ncbi:MAG: YdcF family protein [Oligoflexia bacterium]|nr:YdcF family protein [Oligoflexia bacterium]
MASRVRRGSRIDNIHTRSHRSSIFAGSAAILILLLITGVRFFGDSLYEFPRPYSEKNLPSDGAIICLAGGKFRIEAALQLFSEGIGSRLLIVGAGEKTSPSSILRSHAPQLMGKISQDRFERIQVETESKNTIENAFVVAHFLEKNPDLNEIILITSSYHHKRALLMIEQQIHNKKDLKIIPFVAKEETLDKNNWWHTWLGIQVTVIEYAKLLFARFFVPRIQYL